MIISTARRQCASPSCHSCDASVHLDHAEGVLVLGAVQLLGEEISLVIGRGRLVHPHVAVVCCLLASGDLVEQPDGDAVNTRQVPHGGGVALPDRGDRCLIVLHHHGADGPPDDLLQKELSRQKL